MVEFRPYEKQIIRALIKDFIDPVILEEILSQHTCTYDYTYGGYYVSVGDKRLPNTHTFHTGALISGTDGKKTTGYLVIIFQQEIVLECYLNDGSDEQLGIDFREKDIQIEIKNNTKTN